MPPHPGWRNGLWSGPNIHLYYADRSQRGQNLPAHIAQLGGPGGGRCVYNQPAGPEQQRRAHRRGPAGALAPARTHNLVLVIGRGRVLSGRYIPRQEFGNGPQILYFSHFAANFKLSNVSVFGLWHNPVLPVRPLSGFVEYPRCQVSGLLVRDHRAVARKVF